MTDEQERSVDTMDEQEKRETTKAEKQYGEAGKQHTEAEKLYAEAERQHNEAGDQYTEAEKQYTDTLETSKQAGVKRREEAEQRRAEEEAEQQANKAAKQFADAVKASYQAVAKRGEGAQQRNAELTQKFLDSVINNLRGQAEGNRAMTRELADQQRRAQEAGQSLMQESVSVYVDFVNSMFSSYQGSGTAEGSTREDESQGVGGLKLEYYDSLNVNEISDQLDDLSVEEIERLRDYEVRNKNRRTLMERLNQRIEAGSSS